MDNMDIIITDALDILLPLANAKFEPWQYTKRDIELLSIRVEKCKTATPILELMRGIDAFCRIIDTPSQTDWLELRIMMLKLVRTAYTIRPIKRFASVMAQLATHYPE